MAPLLSATAGAASGSGVLARSSAPLTGGRGGWEGGKDTAGPPLKRVTGGEGFRRGSEKWTGELWNQREQKRSLVGFESILNCKNVFFSLVTFARKAVRLKVPECEKYF